MLACILKITFITDSHDDEVFERQTAGGLLPQLSISHVGYFEIADGTKRSDIFLVSIHLSAFVISSVIPPKPVLLLSLSTSAVTFGVYHFRSPFSLCLGFRV